MAVIDLIQERRESLTATERRLAEVVLEDAQAVAFGTVAALARAADTSGASVVRFANRLGFDGFVELQAAVQQELGAKLRPAVERIREPVADDLLGQALTVELDNVSESLAAVDRRALATTVTRLSS